MAATHALVLGDGSVPAAARLDAVWPGWSAGLDLVIAADGGARHATAVGRSIDLWVGDGDSIGEAGLAAIAEAGIPIRRSPVDKDESDTELALLAALEAGARRVTILGALGGERFDHGLANVWLLGHPGLAGCDVRLLDATVRIRLVGPGRADLGGRIGDLVTLLPFGGDATGLTTDGLRYPLQGESLRSGPSRGLSNVRVAGDAGLTVGSGRILVLETPARFSE
ncbi:MAG: thiamine pyrophosphokinae [Chloroflexota bacterium]|jgi:thiamine pyrophosphokinase|nr:thiamine pyrophosphokinae [Chloroflexota bacterium]MEA2606989.1 thiamine pyrophosphokinae [Chloroflexota bacterium]